MALEAHIVSYQRIKNLLAHNIDLNTGEIHKDPAAKTHIPKHENIRGAAAYQ